MNLFFVCSRRAKETQRQEGKEAQEREKGEEEQKGR